MSDAGLAAFMWFSGGIAVGCFLSLLIFHWLGPR